MPCGDANQGPKLSVVPRRLFLVDLAFPGLAENTATAVDAVTCGLSRLESEALVELVRTSTRSQAQQLALHLALVAEVAARGIPESVGALDTKNWLRATR